jgi:hypothetical protein
MRSVWPCWGYTSATRQMSSAVVGSAGRGGSRKGRLSVSVLSLGVRSTVIP